MFLLTTKDFDRAYAKLPKKIKDKFIERRNLFLRNEFETQLKNHPLTGDFSGFRSINITGDYRAIYYKLDSQTVVFVQIGTHAQLCK